jgi:hypothetical protein
VKWLQLKHVFPTLCFKISSTMIEFIDQTQFAFARFTLQIKKFDLKMRLPFALAMTKASLSLTI